MVWQRLSLIIWRRRLDDRYVVTFTGRGGLTLAKLRQTTADLLLRNSDVIYLDIGTNKIGTRGLTH